jgi:hypothetical protein
VETQGHQRYDDQWSEAGQGILCVKEDIGKYDMLLCVIHNGLCVYYYKETSVSYVLVGCVGKTVKHTVYPSIFLFIINRSTIDKTRAKGTTYIWVSVY